MNDDTQSIQDVFAICEADSIPNFRCKAFTMLRHDATAGQVPWQILILHWGEAYYGYVNRCPHQKNPLNFEREQYFDSTRKFLMCGKHGALFDITTGKCVEGPCEGEGLEPIKLVLLDGDVCVAGVALVEDDSPDEDETMEIMIHPD
jgi:nitrite reductase/ring-hydroxylating ferredoxin subunit